MPRASLQIKNISSILLSALASAASGITVKRWLDGKSFLLPVTLLLLCLGGQIGMVFVESKEEEELSLLREKRLAPERDRVEFNQEIAQQMRTAIRSGDHEAVIRWQDLRRKLNDE